MKKCPICNRYFCFKEEDCNKCDIRKIEKMNQTIPSRRTVGDLIKILSQYPEDTLISGVSGDGYFSDLSTIQANCPDYELNNVGIYFY